VADDGSTAKSIKSLNDQALVAYKSTCIVLTCFIGCQNEAVIV
jgi:hypothetical protein